MSAPDQVSPVVGIDCDRCSSAGSIEYGICQVCLAPFVPVLDLVRRAVVVHRATRVMSSGAPEA